MQKPSDTRFYDAIRHQESCLPKETFFSDFFKHENQIYFEVNYTYIQFFLNFTFEKEENPAAKNTNLNHLEEGKQKLKVKYIINIILKFNLINFFNLTNIFG